VEPAGLSPVAARLHLSTVMPNRCDGCGLPEADLGPMLHDWQAVMTTEGDSRESERERIRLVPSATTR
jgi:hypothetical protein